VTAFAGISVPGGWLNCDGSAIDRTIYVDLFAAIGTTFGAGDGSTTFNIPNLRGRNVIGLNPSETDFDVLGETGGAKRHTLTINEMPAHTHDITDPGHAHGVTDPSHAHGVTDPSHAHGVTDPGHAHSYVNNVGNQSTDDAFGTETAADEVDYSQVTGTNTTGVTVNAATTGVTVNAATTGVTVNTGLTGINITNSTGGSQSHNILDPYMALRYIIKV
jgi:microcystin-dependent protein